MQRHSQILCRRPCNLRMNIANHCIRAKEKIRWGLCISVRESVEHLVLWHAPRRFSFSVGDNWGDWPKWGSCALRHGIQNSMEAILACHPAQSTEWLDWVAKSCELWRIRTGANIQIVRCTVILRRGPCYDHCSWGPCYGPWGDTTRSMLWSLFTRSML